LHALRLLKGYTLDIYGIEAEPSYVAEIKTLAYQLGVKDRVTWHGTIAMKELPSLYAHHHLILNMASETIDKTMLEAMTCGCYPVTTKKNAHAIGIPAAPAADTSMEMAEFIDQYASKAPISADEMYAIVTKKHSLEALVTKMDAYIKSGM
jgi:glycosyltransferase involved in cell wall biosynthesis